MACNCSSCGFDGFMQLCAIYGIFVYIFFICLNKISIMRIVFSKSPSRTQITWLFDELKNVSKTLDSPCVFHYDENWNYKSFLQWTLEYQRILVSSDVTSRKGVTGPSDHTLPGPSQFTPCPPKGTTSPPTIERATWTEGTCLPRNEGTTQRGASPHHLCLHTRSPTTAERSESTGPDLDPSLPS